MDGGLGVDNRHPPNACSPQGFGTPFPAAGEASACTRGAELGGRDERGWVIQSQGWQLIECRDKLHLHPEPVRVVVGVGEGWTLPEVYHPCKGLSRVSKCRLQKCFWFVDTCCSSLKESPPIPTPPPPHPPPLFFLHPPLATSKSSSMRTSSKERRLLIALKRALLDVRHRTRFKINLENIAKKKNNNKKEAAWCEKTLCEQIKIGKQGGDSLKWSLRVKLESCWLSFCHFTPASVLHRILPGLPTLPHYTRCLLCPMNQHAGSIPLPSPPHTRKHDSSVSGELCRFTLLRSTDWEEKLHTPPEVYVIATC